MTRFYLFSILILVFLASCGKNLSTNQIEDRLLGKWRFDNVEFRDKGTMFKKDVTGNWVNYGMEFFYDGTLYFTETKSSVIDTMAGYWYVNESYEWNSNSESNELIQKLELYIYGAEGDVKTMYWEELGITKSKLKSEEKSTKGRYFYKLKR